MGLFNNKMCDAECNNAYCSGYVLGDSFEQNDTKSFSLGAKDERYGHDNLKRYTSDNAFCLDPNQAIVTDIFTFSGNMTCAESRVINTYSDIECQIWWIGDGLCHDACRTNECSDDQNDCDIGCSGDICQFIYNAWTLTFGVGTELVEIREACSFWPLAKAVLDIPDDKNCTEIAIPSDFNGDGRINFREFQVIGVVAMNRDYYNQAQTINCSSCVGMDTYNIGYNLSNITGANQPSVTCTINETAL